MVGVPPGEWVGRLCGCVFRLTVCLGSQWSIMITVISECQLLVFLLSSSCLYFIFSVVRHRAASNLTCSYLQQGTLTEINRLQPDNPHTHREWKRERASPSDSDNNKLLPVLVGEIILFAVLAQSTPTFSILSSKPTSCCWLSLKWPG